LDNQQSRDAPENSGHVSETKVEHKLSLRQIQSRPSWLSEREWQQRLLPAWQLP
jgi:hypothetical protein